MEFDAKTAAENICNWIEKWFEENGAESIAVVGISGGKDSSTVAALCAKALGKDRVIGVLMPSGIQEDIDVSQRLVEFLGIRNVTINIKESVEALKSEVKYQLGEWTKQANTNLPARIRMATLYAVAQSLNGRVANTCNLSEDWVGYNTRYGDSAGDFSPLCKYTVTEVKEIGRYIGLPDEFVDKTPIDGLSGKSDEENLGFTYAVLDRYIRTGEIDDMDAKEKIDRLNKQNLFKLLPMPGYDPDED